MFIIYYRYIWAIRTMVDFNNEATIGTPAVDIVRVLILQARENLLDSLEIYIKKTNASVDWPQDSLRSRILTLFFHLQSYYKRTLTKTEYKDLYNKYTKVFFNSEELTKEEILDFVTSLNDTLDDLRLTRIDNKRVYDRTNIEEDNKENGLH